MTGTVIRTTKFAPHAVDQALAQAVNSIINGDFVAANMLVTANVLRELRAAITGDHPEEADEVETGLVQPGAWVSAHVGDHFQWVADGVHNDELGALRHALEEANSVAPTATVAFIAYGADLAAALKESRE